MNKEQTTLDLFATEKLHEFDDQTNDINLEIECDEKETHEEFEIKGNQESMKTIDIDLASLEENLPYEEDMFEFEDIEIPSEGIDEIIEDLESEDVIDETPKEETEINDEITLEEEIVIETIEEEPVEEIQPEEVEEKKVDVETTEDDLKISYDTGDLEVVEINSKILN